MLCNSLLPHVPLSVSPFSVYTHPSSIIQSIHPCALCRILREAGAQAMHHDRPPTPLDAELAQTRFSVRWEALWGGTS